MFKKFENIADWDAWTYYLCECPENGGGGGTGGGGLPPPIECRPDNPNRPANCPDGPPPSQENVTTTINNMQSGPISSQQPLTTMSDSIKSGDGNTGSCLCVNWMFVIFIVLKSVQAF